MALNNKDLERLWQQADAMGEADIGEIVVCDMCDEDYTHSDKKGGFILQSKGVCPRCTAKTLADLKRYGEEKFIRAVANTDESFKDFILRMRGGNNKIKITRL